MASLNLIAQCCERALVTVGAGLIRPRVVANCLQEEQLFRSW
jgi:hypothetical protein